MRIATAIAVTLWLMGNQPGKNANAPPSVAKLPLLNASNLSYLGSFRADTSDGSGDDKGDLGWGGGALSVTPEGTLLISGNATYSRLCELTIPEDYSKPATFAAPCTDVTEQRLRQIDDGADTRLGGTLVWNGRLIVSAYSYYDADGNQGVSHFASGRRLVSTGDVTGPVRVGSTGAGFVSGYMGLVPEEWSSLLGGPAFTGNCCLSIISRTSSGPALSVFDPDNVGRASPVPATELVGYPLSDALADGEKQNDLYNLSTEIKGAAFPAGTRSVLFIGRHGKGTFCYGTGGESGGKCYDPSNSNNGQHMYPYVHQVWAYDALHLLEVKNRKKRPWQVRPYATWQLKDMDAGGRATIMGAAYDQKTRRLYVTQDFMDRPQVHVYQMSGEGLP